MITTDATHFQIDKDHQGIEKMKTLLNQSQENLQTQSETASESDKNNLGKVTFASEKSSENELSFARLAHIIEGEATILRSFGIGIFLGILGIFCMTLAHLGPFVSIPSSFIGMSSVFIISARKALMNRVNSNNLTTSMPKNVDTLRKSLKLLRSPKTSIDGEREAILDGLMILLSAIKEADNLHFAAKDNTLLLKLLKEKQDKLRVLTLDVLSKSGNQLVIDQLNTLISSNMLPPSVAAKAVSTIEQIRYRLTISSDSGTLLRSASDNQENDQLLTAVSCHQEFPKEDHLRVVQETNIENNTV